MSNVIKVDSSSPSLPVRQAKLFSAFQVEPFIKGLIFGGRAPLVASDSFKPSHVGMNLHTARAAMGGAVSVPGFITGLLWSVAAFAHGQKSVEQLIEGLPSASQFAIARACGSIKKGAGISAGSMETVTLAALQAMLELPAPQKRLSSKGSQTAGTGKSSADDKSSADGETKAANKVLTDREISAGIGMLYSNMDNVAADKAYAAALSAEHEQHAKARWLAERLAEREADKMATHTGKIELFQQLAVDLGVKLTASQLKTLNLAKAA
jgi:hypothetical protein